MENVRILPLGIQSFEVLRTQAYMYIDKTAMIHQLASTYQAIFYVVFTLMGQYIDAEVRSGKGRADAVVKTKDFIFVFEFKLNGTAEEALQQIDDKGYLIPYQLDGRRLVKVGVEFSKEERNIHRFVLN